MFFVYILKSDIDGTYYYGHTADLKMRLKAHNSGKARSTNHGKSIIRKNLRLSPRLIKGKCFLRQLMDTISSRVRILFRGVAEWSIAAVLKTVEPRGSGGSNPSSSALKSHSPADGFFRFESSGPPASWPSPLRHKG